MTKELLEKQKKFYTLVILIPLLVATLWVCLGAFSYLMGWGMVDASYNETQNKAEEQDTNAIEAIYFIQYLMDDEDEYRAIEMTHIQFFVSRKDEGAFNCNDFQLDVHRSGGFTIYRPDHTISNPPQENGSCIFEASVDLTANYIGFEKNANDPSPIDVSDFTFWGSAESEIQGRADKWVGFGADEGSNVADLMYSFCSDDACNETIILPIPPALVWGASPESGTEITSLEDILDVGYQGFDERVDYNSVSITFKHLETGIFTGAKSYEIDDIGESGELNIALEDFDFEKNGNWFLHAVATYAGYQYEGEYFLSGYGWNWTDDLTDGEYYLDINIEGFEEMFVMSNFEDWYFDISKFATPTDMFVSIVGFFDPTFAKIGEFGNRIAEYFNVAESYAQGYEIGRTIPYFTYFVGQISLLLGGFPVLVWLFIVILLLVGFFIFRLILKFIPFLGGS